MDRQFGFENAIAWVHFRLRGGWGNLFGTAGILAGVTLLVLFLMEENMRGGWDGGVTALMGAQAVILVFLGSRQVSRAVSQDISTGIIDSHRLMPMSPWQAVGGYFAGSAVRPLVLAFVIFVIGLGSAARQFLPVGEFVLASGVLVCFSLMLWVICVYWGFHGGRGHGWLLLVVLLLVLRSASELVVILPGARLLLTPLLGSTVFSFRNGALLPYYFIGGLAQAVICGLYFVAAARKYRRRDLPGFTPLMALALLAVWIVLNVVGIFHMDDLGGPMFGRGFPRDTDIELPLGIASSSSMLLALLPLSAAMRMPSGRNQIPMEIATTIAAIFLVWALPAFVTTDSRLGHPVQCLLVVAFFLISTSFLMRLLNRRSLSKWLAIAWLIATWVVLPLLSTTEPFEQSKSIAFVSPPFTLWAIWALPAAPTGAIVVQGCLAAGMVGLYFAARPAKPPANEP